MKPLEGLTILKKRLKVGFFSGMLLLRAALKLSHKQVLLLENCQEQVE